MDSPPSRPPDRHLVFIHGGGVGPWMWRQQETHFRSGYRVHLPVVPGHDPADPQGYTSHTHAARSIAQQIQLTELVGEVTVVGFSLGGQVAVVLSSMFPEMVSRTVIVSSLVRPWRTGRLLASIAGLAAPLTRSERFARRQAKELYVPTEDFDRYFSLSRSMNRSTLVEVMRANLSFRPPAAFLMSTRPVLLLAGSEEQRHLIEDLRDLRATLPLAHFDQIHDVGHGAPLGEAAQFNRALEQWLAPSRT